MNKMKRKVIVILAILTAVVSSCTLESERYGSINTSIFPVNAEDCEALVVGNAYLYFRSSGYNGLYCCNHDGIHVISDMASDIGQCSWSDVYWPELITLNPDANLTDGAVKLYRNNIRGITRMTNTLSRIEPVAMDASRKATMKAELYCARGWLAYVLYNFFGPIQIATQEQLDNPSIKIPAPRKTKEETAKFIEDNLLEALKGDALPVILKKGDARYGRFTQALVHMILLKFYMHEGRWADAVTQGRELMDAQKYGFDLMSNYKDIFTLENEGNKETIWACECATGINEQLWLTHVMPSDYPHTNQKMTLWGGGYKINWAFFDTFDPADKRLETIITEYKSTSTGEILNRDNPGKRFQQGAIPLKYAEDPEQIGEGSQIDWIVFRYADALTLLAEAIVRDKNEITQEAIDLLNKVRTRSLPGKSYSMADFSDVDDFLDAVLLERGHELWFEGTRREDLIRHGVYIEYMKKYKNSKTAAPHMVLWPLPQDVINEGGGVVHQNDGY